MTSTYLQQWIQHPEMLNRDTLYELRTLVARYPYFQSLRLLYLKNLYLLHDASFGAELRKAVLYVSDRRVLFYLIEGDRYTLQSRKLPLLSSNLLKEEPSVDRTLSLIDAFLATVPEEHSQATELDYAMDYTTYLLQDDTCDDAETAAAGEEVPKLRGHELIDGFIRRSESVEFSLRERPAAPVAAATSAASDGVSSESLPASSESLPTSSEPAAASSDPASAASATVSAVSDPVAATSAAIPLSVEEKAGTFDESELSSGKNEDARAALPEGGTSLPGNEAPSSEEDDADGGQPRQNGVDDSCFTETLAKIYIKQHRYEKALEIIKKLSLNYPKKNAYFADQIRFLEKLIINAKSK